MLHTYTRTVLASMALASLCRWIEAAPLRLSENGRSRAVVVCANSDEAEASAARELAAFLEKVTGATFPIMSRIPRDRIPIAVGPTAARGLFPDLDLKLERLGHEGTVLRCDGRGLALSGAEGSRRGTLYAVYTFLEDAVGCRWWTPDSEYVPRRPTLDVPAMERIDRPAFEYRESYIAHTVDPQWPVRNRVNGHFYPIPPELGGHIAYRGYGGGWGFVHTFNTIVPPDEFFADHPEWFSEIDGKRVAPPAKSQWCLTNLQLLALVKGRVRELLRDSPPDSIVEISQNDWGNRCRCEGCLAVEAEEGSPAGPLLRFVNAVADHIAEDFPEAVISTLAYQYTRKPPARTKPRPNVCIRLCSIECSFLQPLEDEANRAFADDIRRWSELTDRLYVWDYVTNFALPLQPFPNLRVLADNMRFFRKHGVRGVFEEGGHYTRGASFSEIRAWVLAKLLWNPDLDGAAMVKEFVRGYYGPAAPPIQEYIDLLHDRAEADGSYMPCFDRKATFLTYDLLERSEALFLEAEEAVRDRPEIRKRVELAHAGVWFGIIKRWPWLKRAQARRGSDAWFTRSRAEYAKDYVRVGREQGVNPKHITPWEHIRQRRDPPPPALVKGLPPNRWVDLQDDLFALYKAGKWADYSEDPAASDGVAVRMPADHHEWATQCTPPLQPAAARRKWAVYVSVRVERAGEEGGIAFTAGIYDTKEARSLGILRVDLADAAPDGEYRLYRIEGGGISPNAYIYVAPAGNPRQVKAVSVDRMILVDESD